MRLDCYSATLRVAARPTFVGLAIITLIALPAAALADPAPSFEVLDRGTAVEVIARNVTMANTAITPIRSRLEVPLVGHPRAEKVLPTDATVKLVELDGNTQRVLSVKLDFERPEVKALAKYAQAIQVGSDVHIMFPRLVPVAGSAVVLPEPTLPAALAAKLATTAPLPIAAVTAPAPVVPAAEAKIEAKIEPKIEPKTEPKTETKPVAAMTAPATTAKPATAAPAKEDAWQKLSMYGAIGLAAVGCGVWLLRRRKAQQGVVSTIDVIAQKSLGGKAKIVWFTAGGREMVVAVTPQSVRMLGQWKKSAGPADNLVSSPLPAAQTYNEGGREVRAEKGASSAAVGGILKLRERRSVHNIPMPMVSDEVATDDIEADTAWAKEILAATGARR
jgi:flagellar biogenesis protein FliO